VMDPNDLAVVHAIQDQLKIEQADKGSFEPSGNWDMEEVLAMRAKYAEIGKVEGVTSETMFGKKGERPLKDHNVGTAMGWGGLTPERAVYPSIYGESLEPQKLTLKDVPTEAFWSITVYDAEGYPQGDVYNINSAFAVPGKDGSFTIHFGGDKDAVNYMDIFEGWNIALRIYEPTETYFNGEWVMPELELVTDQSIEPVTAATFMRAESDVAIKKVYDAFGLNTFFHFRAPVAIDNQTVIRMNRDTLYSSALLDLSKPAVVTMPETDGRYMSLHIINQDHYSFAVIKPGRVELTQDAVGDYLLCHQV
jgi:hypothetical protein